jgi:hypothetical protein
VVRDRLHDSNEHPSVISDEMHRTPKHQVGRRSHWNHVSDDVLEWMRVLRSERNWKAIPGSSP